MSMLGGTISMLGGARWAKHIWHMQLHIEALLPASLEEANLMFSSPMIKLPISISNPVFDCSLFESAPPVP